LFEGGAGKRHGLARLDMLIDQLLERLQPRLSILSGEGRALRHFDHIGGGVVIVAFLEWPAQPLGQAVAKGGFTGAGNAHDDEDGHSSLPWIPGYLNYSPAFSIADLFCLWMGLPLPGPRTGLRLRAVRLSQPANKSPRIFLLILIRLLSVLDWLPRWIPSHRPGSASGKGT